MKADLRSRKWTWTLYTY